MDRNTKTPKPKNPSVKISLSPPLGPRGADFAERALWRAANPRLFGLFARRPEAKSALALAIERLRAKQH